MRRALLLTLAPLALAAPARAQDHSGHDMPGMEMPAKPAAQPEQDPHADHAMPSTQGPDTPAAHDAHQGHPMPAMLAEERAPSGTDLPPGNAPAPAPAADRAADRYYGAEAMAAAERGLRREHGGGTFHQVMIDIAEYQPRRGGDGYRWDGGAWIGGDIDRFRLKSEGEGRFGDRVESADVQALYSRAIDPYWNLQAGVRQDLGPGPRRTYAVIGVEGLAPYWFELGGSLFLSDKGDVLARAEGYYDQRITQDLVLQPRAELDFAFQDVPENAIGSGLSTAELGLRLRYERIREFAPYVGVSWERRLGRTADFARARGDDTGGVDLVLGIRAWF
ncbi:copper resistance protein B [Sphingomonas cannabina]|uniref:copper resistance protein B n=1 Tax=Sphingomonas cannabina TaxID=2899123 RepID=UPI001F2DA9C5|nr:copper resistance protein B [Sphingomonas cannabina]UIJ46474.1 copper resistance protein B [Sphingomonas cannabina]